jgi:hypothetical protein
MTPEFVDKTRMAGGDGIQGITDVEALDGAG